jgi:hypothetical protein
VIDRLVRIPGVRRLWLRFPVGTVSLRVAHDIWDRPAYAYGIFSAAKLAVALGLGRISVIEFGVAGGNGLMSMERIAAAVAEHFGIGIDIYGFDTGTGMPPPRDYRDLPHVWGQGFYRMEPDKLRARLKSASLVLGEVAETTPRLLEARNLAPIGFISFDLDYYSSTKEAFGIFAGRDETRLPRVFCYFDDVTMPERACHNDFTGELCAIREFNEEHERKKIAKLPNLRWLRKRPTLWNEHIFVFHDFSHELYTKMITPVGEGSREKPLR